MRITELTKLKESYSDDYDMDSNWEDDYEGDLDKEEHDKTVKNSQMEYAVWVGGTEVNDQWVSYDEAVRLYDKYKAQGYDDVQLDARIKEDVEEDESVSEDLEDIGNAVKKGYNKVKDLANKKIPTHQEKYGFKRPWLSVDLDNKIRSKVPGWNKGGAPLRSKPLMQSESYSDDEEEVYFNYGDIGGNIIVNPKSTIEDQIAELLNQYYDIGPMEFDPSKIEIQDIDESMNEDEEAVAARDEFMKVMDMKPKSSNKAIDTIKKIVADKQNMQVKFDDGKMKVDLYTASAVSQVYDAVNDANKEKIDNMLRTKEGMLRMSNFAFTKLSEQIQVVENAEKEGRLDEILPLVPLAIGAARVLGPMAAKALAKKFGKKAVANAAGKFKPGMNPKSVATQIKKGGGDGVLKQIWNKSPGVKTGLGVGVADRAGGGSGSGMSVAGDVYNTVLGGDNSSSNSSSSRSSSSDSNISKYAKKVASGWESKKVDGKNISEYAGKDAVLDKNGKPHDPNSSKGKTIVNMKCNNPTVKDKTGCGTGTDKDKKRRNMALLKKGAGMAKDGVKKLGKAAASSVTATGFANPFEGIEDKSVEIMQKAMEQSMDEKGPGFNKAGIDKQKKQKSADHIGKKMDGDNLSPKSNINKVDKNEPWYNQGAFKKNPDNFKGYPDKWKTKKADTKVDKEDKKDDRPWNHLKVNF